MKKMLVIWTAGSDDGRYDVISADSHSHLPVGTVGDSGGG